MGDLLGLDCRREEKGFTKVYSGSNLKLEGPKILHLKFTSPSHLLVCLVIKPSEQPGTVHWRTGEQLEGCSLSAAFRLLQRVGSAVQLIFAFRRLMHSFLVG